MIANLLNYLVTASFLIIPLEGKSYYGSTFYLQWKIAKLEMFQKSASPDWCCSSQLFGRKVLSPELNKWLRETKLWWSARWAGDHPGPCFLLPLLSHLHQDWRVQEGSIFIWIPRSVKRPIWFRTLPPMRPSCCCLTRRPLSRHFTQPRWKTTQFNWESTGINLHLKTFPGVLLCQTWIMSIYSFEFAQFS